MTWVSHGLNALDEDWKQEGSEEDHVEESAQDFNPDPSKGILQGLSIAQFMRNDQENQRQQSEKIVVWVQEKDKGASHLRE